LKKKYIYLRVIQQIQIGEPLRKTLKEREGQLTESIYWRRTWIVYSL